MKPFYTDQAAWVDKAGQIYAALERVKISEEQNPNKLMLRRQNRITSVHATTAIEGNRLSVGEVAGVVNGVTVFGPPRDILEVQNAYAAYEALETFDPYSVASFLKAHALLTAGLVAESGAFRTVDVAVQREDGEVLHTGAEPEIVPKAVGQLLEWAQESPANPLIASSAVHFMIEYIHPFRDGNGRMARALQTLVLAQDALLEPAFSSIEEWLGANTQDYYDALKATQGGTWQPDRSSAHWVRFSLRAHHMQAQTTRQRFDEAGRRWLELDHLLTRHGLPERVEETLFNALLGWRVTRPSYVGATGTDIRTATRDLARLTDLGLLVAHGQTKGRYYTVGGALPSVDETVAATRGPLVDPYPDLLTDIRLAAAQVQPTVQSQRFRQAVSGRPQIRGEPWQGDEGSDGGLSPPATEPSAVYGLVMSNGDAPTRSSWA